jgi:hypothetical protein
VIGNGVVMLHNGLVVTRNKFFLELSKFADQKFFRDSNFVARFKNFSGLPTFSQQQKFL